MRLHYSADEEKGKGAKVFNERQNMLLSPWADGQERGMTDPARYRQEYEIDFAATLGQLVYYMTAEATLVKSFRIPPTWTRYFSLDPHPAVPHAFLWCAVDPFGTRWYYRELWPSKLCGLTGATPSEDNRHTIQEYLEAIKWLESKDNPENRDDKSGFDERIFKRVIDYAARAMGQGTMDDPEMPNFQQRYESKGADLGLVMDFEDAQKDLGVGIEVVNEGLKPIDQLDPATDTFVRKSKIRIFQDKCPELVWELRNNRWRPLAPAMAEMKDHSGKVIEKRKHMTDNLRYIEMAKPEYVPPRKARSTWKPIAKGVNY